MRSVEIDRHVTDCLVADFLASSSVKDVRDILTLFCSAKANVTSPNIHSLLLLFIIIIMSITVVSSY